jgi:hypothetical protein
MKIRYRRLIISLIITGLLAGFIFLVNDNDTEFGASFGAYVKLQMVRYSGAVTGTAALLVAIALRILKKPYANNLLYIFIGVLNISLGMYGIFYFILNADGIHVIHTFLINLLIGVLISSDVFVITEGN